MSGWKRRRRRASPGSTKRRYPRKVKGTGIAPRDLLALALAVRRCTGWVSAKRAGKVKATWEIIYDMHQDVDAYKAFQSEYPGFRVTEDDEVAAELALRWCSDDEDEDYRRNLHRAVDREEVAGGDFALVCSAADAFARETEGRYISESWVGTVGDRGTLELVLKRIRPCPNKYRVAYRLAFVDEHGAEVIWFASKSPAAHGLEIDHAYAIRATIRKHVDFLGSKQTRITRGQVLGAA